MLRFPFSRTHFPAFHSVEKCNVCAVVVRRKIMERGSSVPWQETLGEAIGEDKLDATALREYFRPLEDWLRTENLRTGDVVGWSYGKNISPFLG